MLLLLLLLMMMMVATIHGNKRKMVFYSFVLVVHDRGGPWI